MWNYLNKSVLFSQEIVDGEKVALCTIEINFCMTTGPAYLSCKSKFDPDSALAGCGLNWTLVKIDHHLAATFYQF